MKNRRVGLFVLVLSLVAHFGFAQAPRKDLVQSLAYKITQSGGTNASAVAFDSKNQLYYTLIAGNASFPLEAFDATGKNRYAGEAGLDFRGLWFDAKSSNLFANCPGSEGWYRSGINAVNGPSGWNLVAKGEYQPDFQAVGTYDAKKKQVVFLDYEGEGLACYSVKKPSIQKSIMLNISSLNWGDINGTSVGYTGKKGYEFVVLNFMSGTLHFFNRAGEATAVSKFPSGAPLNESFAFSFANNLAFLYDKEARTWYGYRVF